jgi:hypothetical protein
MLKKTEAGQSLEERLKWHPQLRARFERILGIVEDAAGDLQKADAAEERVTEQLRKLGNEVLHGWARGQETQQVEQLCQRRRVYGKGKKNSTGTAAMGGSNWKNGSIRKAGKGR